MSTVTVATYNTVNNYYYSFDTLTSATAGNYANNYGSTNYVSYPVTATAAVCNSYSYYGNSIYGTVQYGAVPVQPMTKEELKAHQQWLRDEAAKQEARDISCRKRAREALLLVLDERQKKQLESESHFELQVNERLYRVRPGSRVERLDPATKKIQSFFCIHTAYHYGLPSDDVAIAQKLLLETDEAKFLSTANETKAA